MSKETLFAAFSTQKGGMGKTAVTILTASHLHYVRGFNVAVIDCDFPQHSIVKERERDVKLVMENANFKRLAYEQFKTLGNKAYPVEESNTVEAMNAANALIDGAERPYDVIFFDLPGTLNTTGVVKTLAAMDYIFTPISADRLVLESTLQYATMLNDHIISQNKGNIKGLFLFWNMVDGREKSPLYEAYEGAIAELGLTVLNTTLPNSIRFRKEMSNERNSIFRSTLFPPDKMLLKDSNIDVLSNEICEILNLKKDANKQE